MFEIKCTICDTVQELKLSLEEGYYYINTKEIDIEPHMGGELKIKCHCCGFFIEERCCDEETHVYGDDKPAAPIGFSEAVKKAIKKGATFSEIAEMMKKE